jgi:hypothetical protein
MYFLCKNEYRILKPVEVMIRKGLIKVKNSRIDGDEPIWVIIHIYMEMSQ